MQRGRSGDASRCFLASVSKCYSPGEEDRVGEAIELWPFSPTDLGTTDSYSPTMAVCGSSEVRAMPIYSTCKSQRPESLLLPALCISSVFQASAFMNVRYPLICKRQHFVFLFLPTL